MLTVIVLVLGLFIGRYVIPKKRSWPEILVRKLDGTYRDPDLYEVTVGGRTYKVSTINELPKEAREATLKGFEPQHRWMNNLLTGKRPQDDG